MKKIKVALATIILALLLFVTSYAADDAKTINICDYGASGTSSDDQTEHIKAALTAASEGDTVYVPDGTYNISSILLPSGITFKGESRDGAILKANTSGSSVVSLRLSSNVTVESITVDGNMTAKYCLYLKSGSNNTVDNVKMCNLPHAGLVVGLYINGRCTNSVVRNCLFTNIGVRPSGDEVEDKGTGLCIYGNYMFSYNRDDNVLIENNVFDTIGRAGVVGDQVSNVKIIGNTIKNTGYVIGKGLSIEIYGAECKNCIIENNTVDHWISIHGKCHAVRYNKVGTDFIEGEDYFKRYAIENCAHEIIYSDNEVSGGNKYGILDLGSGGNVLFKRNNVNNCTQAAYSANQCTEFGVKNCRYFYDCSFNGTSKNTENAIYPSSSGIGVEVNNNVGKFVFDNVTVSSNKRYGMQFKGISGLITLKDCTISGNTGAGLIFGLTNPFEIRNTVIENNGTDTYSEPTPFANGEPVADFTTDKEEYEPGETVTFTNTSRTADESVSFTQYLWDFGMSLPVTDKDTSFTFSDEGVYKVSLVVWDDSGRGDIVEKTVTVRVKPSETTTQEPSSETTQPVTHPSTENTNQEESKQSLFDIILEFFKTFFEWIRSLFN